MKIFKETDIDEIVQYLKEGKIIAFPTDTVYGLGCIYDSKKGIDAIYRVKGRSETKPLPMMCSSILNIENVAYINELERKLMTKYMPGAFTIVLNKRKEIPDFVTNGFDTIAIRIPDDDFILNLIKKLGKPMLVTSANPSNEPSLFDGDEVMKQLPEIDGIVLGHAKGAMASTIVSATNGLKILRQGILKIEE